ncbi:MAG: tetratricopeptide repeat protein [Proteobacteria bacterium]|nr:tetratricopeptide repeat protein [Pseudomonadota bacterium]
MTTPDDRQQELLAELEPQFMAAIEAKDAGRLDAAEDLFRTILRVDPRIPEPRMELARILLDTDRVAEAEEHAREALVQLKSGGQWTDEIPENIVLGLSHALLAEVLRRRIEDDDIVFGDADRYKAMLAESQSLFAEAAKLDPSDEYASFHAFFLGVPGKGSAGESEG